MHRMGSIPIHTLLHSYGTVPYSYLSILESVEKKLNESPWVRASSQYLPNKVVTVRCLKWRLKQRAGIIYQKYNGLNIESVLIC